ncbi:unnamed protein product [Prorocentrum cordatum]|uniref:Reverse transcriptase Ty1/copia-type domain-containing protein n=1 Tax=Prorocentrum cordatum TaxID=2364126 RepID=A0ABN9YJH3_9DINO|nr:unnamed protein product [Polarella glacialis]
MSHRGPELDLCRPPEKRQKGNDTNDDMDFYVDLYKDKLDIVLGSDELQTVYFEHLCEENGKQVTETIAVPNMAESFLANQRRKDKVELTWSKMNAEERKEYEVAIAKEVDNWQQHQGLRPVPAERVQDAADVIRARWLFTRKSDGKAKARLVLLGYQTKALGKEPTASPTASRGARSVMLTVAAANHWKLIKGDVTSAFLQANQLEKGLFIEPDPVLRRAFDVKEGEVLKVMKPGYGIGEAPRHWWETVKVDFAELGLQACELEPCLWRVRFPKTSRLIGLAMAHVDDLILAGDNSHSLWASIFEQIRKLYEWGTWGDMIDDSIKSLEQCGVTIEENDQGFFLHQHAYADKIREVQPADGGRHRSTDTLRESDQTILRAFCGEVYWLGVNTVPFVLSWVAELQSKIPGGARNLFSAANNIVKLIKQRQRMGLQIYRHNSTTWPCPPGAMQPGPVGPTAIEGEKAKFTVLDWGSKKLRRVARSSLAAEVQEAGDAEGEQCMVRMVLSELLYNRSPTQERATLLKAIPAVLVTDCKAFYDGVVRSQSAGLGLGERRAAVEALALRNALDEGNAVVRWVHSRAQIADGLTKGNWQAFGVLKLFLEKQEWRLIYDEHFMSARKRAALGKGIFEPTAPGDSQVGQGGHREATPASTTATVRTTTGRISAKSVRPVLGLQQKSS